ncbi:precorrin-6y C5,15-methyltransferase (decarboxylating) subunit CbiE (plasmid) [Cetobacterium somerae]|uniref:precorrin-6y C5,15-methyltransferase (decarboxylating) subunit CbiE n=1 Tax=Cetobacterium somerae TaxID=188913 RepID=UPI003D769EB3
MNKKLTVVGLGPGNLDYLTKIGLEKIKKSEIVIGGQRQLEEIKSLLDNQYIYVMKKLNDMKEFVLKNLDKEIVFIVSGDTGYYSLLTYLKENFKRESFNVIPGISSFQYLFSKIELTWEHYGLYSLHGRKIDYIEKFKESEAGLVLLTDEINNPIEISKELVENNFFNVEIIIGERLSYEDELITRFLVKEYKKYDKKYKMNVIILRKV